jgi:dTDP-4-dehydrorhamnose 3,5-epimerase
MQFETTRIEGCYLVSPEPREDERGFFERRWCQKEASSAGITVNFVQVNYSFNPLQHTLRGLHYQLEAAAEDKLVECLQGEIFDVALDLRPTSPTHGQWFGTTLCARQRQSLFIPKGCAHGYLTLTPQTGVQYHVSSPYAPQAERGCRWNDPAWAIDWPAHEQLHLSPKDAAWPLASP